MFRKLIFTISIILIINASAMGHEKHAVEITDEQIKAALSDDSTIALKFGSKTVLVEYADEHHERALGLMYRRSLCADCGMLFKFDSNQVASIWMKNTFIPLDLAYIDESGKIVEIHQLEPFNLTPVASSKPVLYALEMNLGWFGKYKIQPNQTIKIQGIHNF